MTNTPQNQNPNQYKQGAIPAGPKARETASENGKNTDRNSKMQQDSNKSYNANDRDGTRNDPESPENKGPRREREEEDRPRADKK